MHKWARTAAEIAACADIEAGDEAFWKINDFFFKHQTTITVENITAETMNFIEQQPGMNPQGVSSCLAAHRGDSVIERDRLTAQKLGVSGTPTLFVNGAQVRGVTSTDSLVAVIDQAELGARRANRPDGENR